jgi:hypothetical protein
MRAYRLNPVARQETGIELAGPNSAPLRVPILVARPWVFSHRQAGLGTQLRRVCGEFGDLFPDSGAFGPDGGGVAMSGVDNGVIG